MPFSDADLIARVLAREDHNAFGELVRRHQSPVRAFLARMARGDAHLADDLAQETFLKAWKKLHTFRGNARFSTWLFGIAFNEFRDFVRRRKELALEDADNLPNEPATARDGLLRLDLTEALKRLSSNERAAVVLCCQNGLSHEEVSQVLDCPLGTVKTNILRGKDKLRRLLAPAYKNYESAGN
ncbi:MAG TPA: sigma-70 family RNA polymerase sigma factor [Verrucomicrobiae bacterium]|nr:sigma-70 family RNA polymerase sigma factor [Verrucomicrobiae bacterium]